jgi:hypothetical protein
MRLLWRRLSFTALENTLILMVPSVSDSGGFLPRGPAAQRAATDAEPAEILQR